jgi:hypothetical protein
MKKFANQYKGTPPHKVIANYSSPYGVAILFAKDEIVEILQKETEWPGWIWCINLQGEKRWVPDVYLQIDGNQGRLLKDYNARELAAQKGDAVTVLYQVNEWGWCIDSEGDEGWLPLDHLVEL